jgi:hypothetical protein
VVLAEPVVTDLALTRATTDRARPTDSHHLVVFPQLRPSWLFDYGDHRGSFRKGTVVRSTQSDRAAGHA